MLRGREREGLRECRAAWLIGTNVRRYRELEAGEAWPTPTEWRGMCRTFNWPEAFSRGLGAEDKVR